ncbi:hypothetical protein GQ600_27559 [Phytophthora cactorum]|nr:hypothetical protein GQ600_27559 [Phytophthora cactorum]
MPERRGGGSQMTVATRNRKEAAYARAIALLGEETVKRIRNDWDSWDTAKEARNGRNWKVRCYSYCSKVYLSG